MRTAAWLVIATAAVACAAPRPAPPRPVAIPKPASPPPTAEPAPPEDRPVARRRFDPIADRKLTDEQRVARHREERDIAEQAAAVARTRELQLRDGLSSKTAALVADIEATHLFAIGPLGPTAAKSPLESAARLIAREPDARAAALVLARRWTAASLYGLWIAAAVDPRTAATIADDLRRRAVTVPRLSGCFLDDALPIAQAVDEVLADPM